MSLSLRFLIPLVILLGLTAYVSMIVTEGLTLRWFSGDVELRSRLVFNTIEPSLVDAILRKDRKGIERMFTRAVLDDRLLAIGFCNRENEIQYRSSGFALYGRCPQIGEDIEAASGVHKDTKLDFFRLEGEGALLGHLVLIHDISFIKRRSEQTNRYIFYFFFGLALLVALITVTVVQVSWRGWIRGLRAMIKGEILTQPGSVRTISPELIPVMKDFRSLIKDLEVARRQRDDSQTTWSPKVLKDILKGELAGDEIIIVSNREPYIHIKKNQRIEVQMPASGLVTALEPVMRACSGIWVAHGSGNADREMVDPQDHVRVPPEDPSYVLRRVWMNEEEERGYYYGFANEGLWPLCHIAYTRPIFRQEDWQHYTQMNQRFADAVVQEAKSEDPVVLVQDYHFALLPRMIREKLPDATIITFWHIPWPNSEAFGICPWREEILDGLLGSSILGFHTRVHCNNFLDAVDRFLESRIDRDSSNVTYGAKVTAVRQYPISIDWPVKLLQKTLPVSECRKSVRDRHGLASDHLIGIGVDRLDYTKGILERFRSVEKLLEIHPEWVGRFSFIQIAAPSRSILETYRAFSEEVRTLTDRINQRFGSATYKPIILIAEHHEPESVFEYYRAADLCFVSSLHDGMNLVAKEFISSRDDEHGVLVLSLFTGASRELPEAIIVNPYNIDQCAEALHLALQMPMKEQRDRMRTMRNYVREFNVYRWAGRMLMDAARIRQQNRLQKRFYRSKSRMV